MEIDRRAFLATLGGAAALDTMDPEAKAEALEHYMMQQLDTTASPPAPAPNPWRRGTGNLFTVFGEPDIVIEPQPDDKLVVEIRGLDIYDPTTGEYLSSGSGSDGTLFFLNGFWTTERSDHRLTMPCQGSTGAGEPMGFSIIYTAIAP